MLGKLLKELFPEYEIQKIEIGDRTTNISDIIFLAGSPFYAMIVDGNLSYEIHPLPDQKILVKEWFTPEKDYIISLNDPKSINELKELIHERRSI